MKGKSRKLSKRKPPSKDMLEAYNISPWYSLGKILPTSNKPKQDVFEMFRRDKGRVDYKISETWTKMQSGDVKINVKQTSAIYSEMPLEIRKPTPEKASKKVCLKLLIHLFLIMSTKSTYLHLTSTYHIPSSAAKAIECDIERFIYNFCVVTG